MSPLTEPTRLTLRKSWQPMDSDAAAYITAVETADGQALEEKVKIAIDNFVLGCKADGIWTAIKASCILAGARTFAGALIPLKGIAPTKFGTEGNWSYNRKTGLQGDGSTNYLNSNRNNNTDPQNNFHFTVYTTVAPTSGASQFPLFIGSGSVTGASQLFRYNNNGSIGFRNRASAALVAIGSGASTGLIGSTRDNASSVLTRKDGITTSYTSASEAPASSDLRVSSDSNARLAFYSIGESLNLALLDARVTDLINAFGAAIP